MKVFVAVVVALMGIGVICEKDKRKEVCLTMGFIVSMVVLAVMMLN